MWWAVSYSALPQAACEPLAELMIVHGQFTTVVSGLPRSGTSMMMQMLEAGGLPVLIDGHRPPDEDNPHGYYEFEPAKRLHTDSSWLTAARGKAIKIVYRLLYELPSDGGQYKVLLMDRELEEVLASQRVMLQRRGEVTNPREDARLGRMFSNDLQKLKGWLQQQQHFSVLQVSYLDVLSNPEVAAIAVDRFLGLGLNTRAMAAVVDHSLYRQRG